MCACVQVCFWNCVCVCPYQLHLWLPAHAGVVNSVVTSVGVDAGFPGPLGMIFPCLVCLLSQDIIKKEPEPAVSEGLFGTGWIDLYHVSTCLYEEKRWKEGDNQNVSECIKWFVHIYIFIYLWSYIYIYKIYEFCLFLFWPILFHVYVYQYFLLGMKPCCISTHAHLLLIHVVDIWMHLDYRYGETRWNKSHHTHYISLYHTTSHFDTCSYISIHSLLGFHPVSVHRLLPRCRTAISECIHKAERGPWTSEIVVGVSRKWMAIGSTVYRVLFCSDGHG